MAELLNKIPSNLTEYPNSFKRQGAFPLEAYSVFYTMDAAEAYASSNPISYVGQTLAVVTANAENPAVVDDVTFYIIADSDGTLQEVGKATNGDDNTITLTDGVLSLKGFDAAPNATLPQKTPVYVKDEDGNDTEVIDHYELRWVAIDAIVEGDTNTKTIVAAGDGETHVIIEDNYVEETDTHTYKVSLDLSAYATTAAVGNAIDATKEELSAAIAAEKTAREAAIGVASAPAIGEEGAEDYVPAVEASGLHAVIEEGNAALEQKIADALAEAKQYADDNDADTVYDDTEITEDIADHESRIGAIESTIGDETQGLIKALADETAARTQGDTDTLNSAKTYTDEEITGLDIVIEKKTVENVESDYIIIKNKAGAEVASVNAAEFVKDGMLDSAVYSTETKKLVLTWNTDAGKSATEIDLNDLVNTYIGSEHIAVSNEGVISVKDTVALKSDLASLNTSLTEVINTKRTQEEVDAQIDTKLVSVNTEIAKKADAETTNAAIALKADQTALEEAVETLEGEIAKKADAETTTNALNNKVDKSEYATDKASFALKSEVEGQFTAIGQRIDAVAEDVAANADAIEELGTDVATNYATKTEVAGVESKADSNTADITNLTSRLDGIVAQGGEPNTINTIKVNGVTQTIDSNKAVDITVPVISETKVSQLNDGQALLDRVTETETDIGALETAVSGNQTGISTLTTRVSALETEVRVEGESRIDALEGIVTGDGTDENKGLVGKVAAHTTQLSSLAAKDTELEAEVDANTAKLVGVSTTVADLIDSKIAAIPEVDQSGKVDKADFEAYQTTVTTELGKKVDTTTYENYKTETATLIGTKANAADVYDKTTADATFVKEAEFESKVDARINTLIDGANAEDTITKVTDLVNFVNENAGDIAQLITDVEANSDAIATNADGIAANKAAHEKNASDIAALTTAVEAQKVIESTEISTTTVEGGVQLGIKEINVNKLVQTTGDVLVLNGGSANA